MLAAIRRGRFEVSGIHCLIVTCSGNSKFLTEWPNFCDDSIVFKIVQGTLSELDVRISYLPAQCVAEEVFLAHSRLPHDSREWRVGAVHSTTKLADGF